MFNPELTTAVSNFTKLFSAFPDAELDHPWHWKGHDEGVRFASFVVSRELRELAVRLETTLPPASAAQRILAQYHGAFLDLQAVLSGISHEDAILSPSEKDWPVRRVFAHVLGADISFSAVIRNALAGHRAGNWSPAPVSDADFLRVAGLSEAEYESLMTGPYESLIAYHQSLHPQIVSEFSTITSAELDLPATFWEPEAFPIRYRLHRYEAHLRQHTIQIEKTLSAIDLAPSEAKQLNRMIIAALAQVDGSLIGTDPAGPAGCSAAIAAINTITSEIAQIPPAHSLTTPKSLAM